MWTEGCPQPAQKCELLFPTNPALPGQVAWLFCALLYPMLGMVPGSVRAPCMSEGRATHRLPLTEVRPKAGPLWEVRLSQTGLGAPYREGAQIGHETSGHQHITGDIVKHVLQILHRLLPAYPLFRQPTDELQRQPHQGGVGSGTLGWGSVRPCPGEPQAAGEGVQLATPGPPDPSSPCRGHPQALPRGLCTPCQHGPAAAHTAHT